MKNIYLSTSEKSKSLFSLKTRTQDNIQSEINSENIHIYSNEYKDTGQVNDASDGE